MRCPSGSEKRGCSGPEKNLRKTEKMQAWDTFLKNETIRTYLRQNWDLRNLPRHNLRRKKERNEISLRQKKEKNEPIFFSRARYIANWDYLITIDVFQMLIKSVCNCTQIKSLKAVLSTKDWWASNVRCIYVSVSQLTRILSLCGFDPVFNSILLDIRKHFQFC